MLANMRRTLAMLLALVTLLTAAPFAAAAEELLGDVVVAEQEFEDEPVIEDEPALEEEEPSLEEPVLDKMDVVFEEITQLPDEEPEQQPEEPEQGESGAEGTVPGIELMPEEEIDENPGEAAEGEASGSAGEKAEEDADGEVSMDVLPDLIAATNPGEISLNIPFSGTANTQTAQEHKVDISITGRYLLEMSATQRMEAYVYEGSTYHAGVGLACKGTTTHWCVDLEAGKTYTFKIYVDDDYVASGTTSSYTAKLSLYINGSYKDRAKSLAYGTAANFDIKYSNDYQIFCFTAISGSKYNIATTGSIYRFIEVRNENFDVVATSSRDVYGNNSFYATLTPGNVYYLVVHGRDYDYYYSDSNYHFWYETGSGTIKVTCTDANVQQITFTMNRSGVAPGFGASVKFNVTSAYAEKVRVLADGIYVGQEHEVVNGKASFSQSFHVSGTRSIQIEGYYNGQWSLRSAAQTLNVYSRPALGTPAFTSISGDRGTTPANRDYTLAWKDLSGAVSYTVYVYSGTEQIYKQDTDIPQITIPGAIFATPGEYYVDVYGLADVGQQSNPAARATILVEANTLEIVGAEVITIGKSATLTVYDENGKKLNNKKLQWTSSDTSRATVSTSGVVKGVGVGFVTITATDANGASASVDILIAAKATAVILYNQGGDVLSQNVTYIVDMAKYPTIQLYAEVLPMWASGNVTWASSNKKVATVSEGGLVTMLQEGSVKITATTKDGTNKRATLKLKIQDPYKPTGITLNDSGTITISKGEKRTLGYSLQPTSAKATLTWKSSNAKVAEVSGGVVTGMAEGTVTITVQTHNGKKDTVKVKVVDPYKPDSITLKDSGTVTISKNQTYKLGYSLSPITARADLAWTSSNAKVATVDTNGNVKGLAEGTVTITVKTHNNKKDTVKVKVVDPYKPDSITLKDSATVILSKNQTYKLGYTLNPTTARADLIWTSSNAKVATVDTYGNVKGLAEGTVTITVKTHNNKKDTVKVQVVDPYKPASVEMTETGTLSIRMKDTLQLHAKVLPATADQSITWKSSNTKCATVNAYGLVTGIKAGTVTITAQSSNGKKDTVKVKITEYYPVEALDLTYDGLTYANMYVGNSLKLNVTYTPAKAKNFASLSWRSSNTSVATVAADGTVKAVGKGDAVITVTDSVTGKSDTFGVVVTRQPRYRAMVTVENTYVTIGGYYKRVYTRGSDRDGFKKILSQQNFDGRKFEQIADLSNMSKTSLMNQIKSLPTQWGVCEDDVTYFFFGGHGSPSGQLFLYSNGAENQYINPSELKAALDKIPGKVVVVIEACYSGNYVYGRNAAGEDASATPEDFTSAIIDVFSEGDTIPVVMLDEEGNEVTLSEENMEFWSQEGVMSNAGELRQKKYYVLTAASNTQSSWSAYQYNRSTKNIIESKSFGLFSRSVCIAGGYDSVTKKTTWKSGEKTLQSVYQSVQKKVDEYRKSMGIPDAQSVQVYPANSNFVIFSK